jgi:photosystem II stability/assembly factor-like uncharacterized protein
MKKLVTTLLITILFFHVSAQNSEYYFKVIPATSKTVPEWVKMMYSENPNVLEVESLHNTYYDKHGFKKNEHTQNYEYWIKIVRNLIDSNGFITSPKNDQLYHGKRKNTKVGNAIWKNIGPLETYATLMDKSVIPVSYQANVFCMDQSASNPSILVAGTESAGVYKTTDKGLNWSLMTLDVPVKKIEEIKIAPSNPNIIYFISGLHFYKSIDGGENWEDKGIKSGHQIIIHPTNPNIVLLASNLGLAKTTNGGDTWSYVLRKTVNLQGQVISEKCYDIDFHPANPNIVYAILRRTVRKSGMSRYGQLDFYKSIDGGTTWAIKSQGWYAAEDINNARADGGLIAVTPKAPNNVYVALIGTHKTVNKKEWIGMYRSSNAGESWYNPAGQDGTKYWAGSAQGFYNMGFGVSHNDENLIFLGGQSFAKSTDGGATWARIANMFKASAGKLEYVHPDIQDIHIQGNDIWYASDGGINYSSDELNTHESRKNGISGSDFWGFDVGWNEDVMVGGRYHNGNTGFYQTYGEGNHLFLGGAEQPTGFVNKFKNREVYFNDIPNLRLPQSINEPTQKISGISKYPFSRYWPGISSELEYHPFDGNTCYMGNKGEVWKSTDQGYFFKKISNFTTPNTSIGELEISNSKPSLIYIRRGNNLYKTVDDGASWQKLPTPTGVDFKNSSLALNPENDQELWTTSNSGSKIYVYRTSNGGNTWSKMRTGSTGEKNGSIVYQGGSDIVYLATSIGVFYWDNSAGTWVDYSLGLPVVPSTLTLKPFYKKGVLRLSTSRGIWEAPFVKKSKLISNPVVNTQSVLCKNSISSFDSYSIVDESGGNATWKWEFNPQPEYVSSLTVRTPKVKFGKTGKFTAKLTVTDFHGNSASKSLHEIIVEQKCMNVDSWSGNALALDGAVQSIVIQNDVALTKTFTFSAWIKPTGMQIQAKYGKDIIIKGIGEQSGILYFTGNENKLKLNWPGVYLISPSLKADEWNYVVLSIGETEQFILVNNKKIVRNHISKERDISSILIGGYKTFGKFRKESFSGEIDEVCFWSRALSYEEAIKLRHITKDSLIKSDTTLFTYLQFNNQENTIYNASNGKTYNIPIVTEIQKTTSTAPIGGGESYLLNLSNSNPSNFSMGTTGLNIDLANLSTTGEIVATRLDLNPNVLPNQNPTVGSYWILNNYSLNSPNLLKMAFSPNTGLSPGVNPSNALLYTREENGFLNNWNQKCGANNVTSTSIKYDNTCNIQKLGIQLLIQSADGSQITNDIILGSTISYNETNSVSVYPNPVDGDLSISFSYIGNDPIKVKMYTISGKLVKDVFLEKNQTMPLGEMKNGIYMLRIQGKEFIQIRKINIL